MLKGLSFPVVLLVVVGVMAVGAIVVVRLVRAGEEREKQFTADEVEATKAAARPILDAIARYRADKGKLPWRLESLVPEYLASLPSPALAYKSWAYELREDQREFSLGFSTSARRAIAWWWQSDVARWSGPSM